MPCQIHLRAGEKKQVILEPLASYEMLATLIRGASPGKTVLITAGIHAGEYPGIPALLLECDHTGYCLPEWIESDLRNIRLLLSYLGCLPDPERSACEHHVFVRTVYLESGEKGLWYPAVAQNEPVGKGQLLGRTEDFFGNTLHEYFTEAGGVVFYHTCGLSVLPGTPLVAYGVEKEARR